ncbi:HNH endonuclease [Aerococcaceae bacterium WGS1372]
MASKSEAQNEFYNSSRWRKVRDYVMAKNNYLCERCNRPAKIVHHIEWLNDNNLNDFDIALNEANLMAVCQECHNFIHYSKGLIEDGLMFTPDGDIIQT